MISPFFPSFEDPIGLTPLFSEYDNLLQIDSLNLPPTDFLILDLPMPSLDGTDLPPPLSPERVSELGVSTSLPIGDATFALYQKKLEEKHLSNDPKEVYLEPETSQTKNSPSLSLTVQKQECSTKINSKFPPYEKVQAELKQMGIKTKDQYRKIWKSKLKEKLFPACPYLTYKEEWKSWGSFLQTGRVSSRTKSFVSYEKAQGVLKQMGVKTEAQYRKIYKKKGLPSNPHQFYKRKWKSWGSFLQTGRVFSRTKSFVSYEEAQGLLKQMGITTKAQYREIWREELKQKLLPSCPNSTYKEEWESWGRFLQTERVSPIPNHFASYEEARVMLKQMGIKTKTEYCKIWKSELRRKLLPANPYLTYKKEWKSWCEFLQNGRISTKLKNFISYEEAKTLVKQMGISTREEYVKICKDLSKSLPYNPNRTYKKEWVSWKKFLQTG